MVDHRPQYRPYDPDIRPYDPDIEEYRENLSDRRVVPYKLEQSYRTDSNSQDSIPLFLSDYDGEPYPSEYMTPVRKDRRLSVSSRILAAVLASAAVAILVAMFSSDATRDLIVNAKASSTTVVPAPSAAQPNPAQQTARDIALKDPTRLSAPANQTAGVRTVTTVAVAAPTREEIAAAYQSALPSRAPAAAAAAVATAPIATAPVAAPANPPPARKLDAEEVAMLLNRAKGLLAAGDIASARLLLERAADAQETRAMLLLAQTYDPEVLGTQDIRNIVPDPAMARVWYQKAAQLGSADAQRRLAQLQN
jgi:TPR repeat protein